MIPYAEFAVLPVAERDAICAEKMGWELSDDGSTWCVDGECLRGIEDWSPTTDRNDAAMMVEKVFRDGKESIVTFERALHPHVEDSSWPVGPYSVLLLDPCLIAYCACVALEGA